MGPTPSLGERGLWEIVDSQLLVMKFNFQRKEERQIRS